MQMIVHDLACTTDTDVLVLAIGHFHKMTATELWIAFGCGENFRYVAAYDITNSLGQGKHVLFWHFMPPSQCPFSLGGERKQLGIPGMHSLKLLVLFWPW
jgi:hypothetical protein